MKIATEVPYISRIRQGMVRHGTVMGHVCPFGTDGNGSWGGGSVPKGQTFGQGGAALNGMTAVTLLAEALCMVDTISSSSIRLSFTGFCPLWTMYTSVFRLWSFFHGFLLRTRPFCPGQRAARRNGGTKDSRRRGGRADRKGARINVNASSMVRHACLGKGVVALHTLHRRRAAGRRPNSLTALPQNIHMGRRRFL